MMVFDRQGLPCRVRGWTILRWSAPPPFSATVSNTSQPVMTLRKVRRNRIASLDETRATGTRRHAASGIYQGLRLWIRRWRVPAGQRHPRLQEAVSERSCPPPPPRPPREGCLRTRPRRRSPVLELELAARVQLRTITGAILAGIPSSGYTDRAQIPSKHLVGGSNPSRGTILDLNSTTHCAAASGAGQRSTRRWLQRANA